MKLPSRAMTASRFLRSNPACRFVLSVVITALAVSAVLGLVWPKLSARAQFPGSANGAVEMPWQFHHTSLGNILNVDLDVGWLTTRAWQIIPDDDLHSITVNGRSVALSGVRPGGLGDYTYGFEIDLSDYLMDGHNEIVFLIDNHGGDGGLNLRPVLGPVRWSFIGLAFLPLLLGLARLFRLHFAQTIALGFALIVLCCYWAATPWGMRSHDVGGGGHLEYVTYVATHHALPNPMQGWTFYHPPLYYIFGALAWTWAKWLSLPAPECVQALSVALWLVFLTASAGTLRLALRNRLGALFLATATVAFWPSGIIHALRIGNDTTLYATAAVATWFMVRWWLARRRYDLWGMSIAIALALLSKSNATVLLAAAGILVASAAGSLLIRRKSQRWRRPLVDLVIFSGVTGLGFALSFAVRLYYYLHGSINNWFISNVNSLGGSLRVPVDVKSFLPLDIPTFLTQPWLETGNDATGRSNFWNYLMRSSLSGEFQFPGKMHRVLAILMGVVLFALCVSALHRFAQSITKRQARTIHVQRPWLLLTFLWIASVAALRVKAPFACSNDFRYVLPVIVPATLYWSGCGPFTKILMAVMTLLSVVFFVAL